VTRIPLETNPAADQRQHFELSFIRFHNSLSHKLTPRSVGRPSSAATTYNKKPQVWHLLARTRISFRSRRRGSRWERRRRLTNIINLVCCTYSLSFVEFILLVAVSIPIIFCFHSLMSFFLVLGKIDIMSGTIVWSHISTSSSKLPLLCLVFNHIVEHIIEAQKLKSSLSLFSVSIHSRQHYYHVQVVHPQTPELYHRVFPNQK